MDLFTVVMHELGHVLGLLDLDPSAHAGDLMAGTLTAATRRLPLTGTLQELPAVTSDDELPDLTLPAADISPLGAAVGSTPGSADAMPLFDGSGSWPAAVAALLAGQPPLTAAPIGGAFQVPPAVQAGSFQPAALPTSAQEGNGWSVTAEWPGSRSSEAAVLDHLFAGWDGDFLRRGLEDPLA